MNEYCSVLNKDLFTAQFGKCFYCNEFINNKSWTKDNPKGFTRDHFYPRRINILLVDNKVLSCKRCNEIKKSRTPFIKEIAKFYQVYTRVELLQLRDDFNK